MSRRRSPSRPTNGASSPCSRSRPPTPATTRAARHSRSGSALPLTDVLAGVLVGDRRRGHLPGDLVDQHRAGLGRRLDARRGVDPVADDQPLARVARAPRPARSRRRPAPADPGRRPRSPNTVTASTISSAGTDGPLGVVLARRRDAPHRHHGVADELLDYAAVAVDDRARRIEVAPSSSRTSSASRGSDSDVKPTRSTNSTDTSRSSGSSRRGDRHRGPGWATYWRSAQRRTRRRSAARAHAPPHRPGNAGREPLRTRGRTWRLPCWPSHMPDRPLRSPARMDRSLA